METSHDSSLKTIQDIRSIMERSARFLSLSGWSGIWAGTTGLAGAYIAWQWVKDLRISGHYDAATSSMVPSDHYDAAVNKFILLAIVVFLVALSGALYFTWRKARTQGGTLWNSASRRMMVQIAIPMIAGGVFALKFLYDHQGSYVAPTCLAFYGLALINGSKYTLTDIKYLGMLEVTLGCISLFLPGYGLISWAIGFGALHILYGIIMWNKYDKHISMENT